MATFQCTYQWTRRFLRGREGATLCRHTQIVCVSRAIRKRSSAPCANIGLVIKVKSPPKAKATRSNRVGCANFFLFCSAICGLGLKPQLCLVRVSKQYPKKIVTECR